jgi:hypothetical protein
MAIPELKVKVAADTSALQSGMQAARSELDRFAQRAGVIGKVAGRTFGALGLAASGAGAAILAMSRSIANSADAMAKAAQKTGIAMSELQKLGYAAGLAGVSSGQLQTAVVRLSRGMTELSRGVSNDATKALSALGVEVKNADGSLRSSSEVMADIAEKFSGFRDGAEKSALAVQIFGRAGAEMIPMLNGGREAIESARREMEQFGAVASDKLGKDSERLNDNISRMGTFFTGIATQVAERVVPALADATDKIVGWMLQSNIAVGIGNALSHTFQNLETYATVAGAAIALMFGPAAIAGVAALAAAIKTVLIGAITALGVAIVANPISAAFIAAAAAAYYFRDEINKAIGVDVLNVVKQAANTVIGSFRAAGTDIAFVFGNLGNIVGAAMIGVVNAVIRAINSMVNAAKSGVNLLIAAINKIPGVKVDPLDTSASAITELANNYANNLGPALAERNKAIGEQMSRDYVGAFISGVKAQSQQIQDAFKPPAPVVNSETGGGGGGGGSKQEEDELKQLRERLERRLEVIRQSVLNEEQLAIHKHAKAQEIAAQAFELDMQIYAQNEEMKLQKTQEYHQLREALEKKHQENLNTLRAAANSRSLNDLASFFSGAQALAQSNGNKSFKMAKAMAIGQAILSTTAAAIQAMADPTAITPFQKFANYAAVLGKGLAAVASIRGMQPTGGGGGGVGGSSGGGSSGGAEASSPNLAAQRSVYVNLQGTTFGRDQVRDLLEQIAAYQSDGGKVVIA